jgi:hypothetical protein
MRAILPARRPHFVLSFEHEGQKYTGAYGVDRYGNIAELWLNASKPSGALDTFASGMAILASIALQHGASLETLRHALRRGPNGEPCCPLGALIDAIAETGKGVRG